MSDTAIKIGIIGGSGLGELLHGHEGKRHDVHTPFGRPSDAIVEAEVEGVPVLMLKRHGPGHVLSPTAVPYRANVFALKELGCTHLLASGAVGSLRTEYKPRELVIPSQVIDKTHRREATFYEKAAVHVEFAEPFCPVLRQILLAAKPAAPAADAPKGDGAPKSDANSEQTAAAVVHDGGCYVCMEGPAFSSRAESLMHRLWGGDLIGMTVMPEAKLAREAELPYALVALVTDYDSWKPAATPKPGEAAPPPADPDALLGEIIGNLKAASANAMELIRSTLRRIAADPSALAGCPAASALRLAIWSDKAAIDPEEVRRLGPLWGKYFG